MPTQLPSDEPSADLHGKVLYIEDVDINYTVVEAILARHAGVQVLRASSGAEGIEREIGRAHV